MAVECNTDKDREKNRYAPRNVAGKTEEGSCMAL